MNNLWFLQLIAFNALTYTFFLDYKDKKEIEQIAIIMQFFYNLNPINLYVKWTIVSFEDFQILLIEQNRRINILSSKLIFNHDRVKNEKLRQIAFITSTIEDDKQKLEEMFWPTKLETARNKLLNKHAREWLIE